MTAMLVVSLISIGSAAYAVPDDTVSKIAKVSSAPLFHFFPASFFLLYSNRSIGRCQIFFFYLFLLVIYSLIITYGIAYDKFLLIIVYVNRFSKDPYKIVPQPHYKQKMELTWPMAARLSVSPSIPPFLIPTYGTIRDFLRALLKAFRSAALFGTSTGVTFLKSRLPAYHFAGPQGP